MIRSAIAKQFNCYILLDKLIKILLEQVFRVSFDRGL